MELERDEVGRVRFGSMVEVLDELRILQPERRRFTRELWRAMDGAAAEIRKRKREREKEAADAVKETEARRRRGNQGPGAEESE